MKNNNKKLSGKEGFEIYYDGLFGKRWNDLRNSLLEPVRQYEYTGGLLKPYFLDCGSVAAGFSLPGFPEEEEEKEQETNRIEEVYGKVASGNTPRRANLFLFTENDLVNEGIISLVENTPTYLRQKQTLKQIQSLSEHRPEDHAEDDATPHSVVF